ncbi:MAG: hypothetical protein JSV10_03290 [Candidatus Zixiibacteriota bacterium]|nr:MAG: hypothetical protein JSV10_03290 [candidate division Zixibacteria bacterium]
MALNSRCIRPHVDAVLGEPIYFAFHVAHTDSFSGTFQELLDGGDIPFSGNFLVVDSTAT